MNAHPLTALVSVAICLGAVWLSGGPGAQPAGWAEVAPGVLRSPGSPAGYALVDGDAALLIDAPLGAAGLKRPVELVLLTHHHRDTCATAGEFLAAGVKVRAPKASAEWLLPGPVAKYWQESLPLRSSRTAYFVVPVGLKGIDCSLDDGQKIAWRGWTLEVVATPGHACDHVAYLARKGDGPGVLFCGDALASSGTMPSPYTTDWDHWTDAGLKPAANSLRRLAALKPKLLLTARGDVMDRDPVAALEKTAANVEEVAFLKSFERFTKQRLGNAPAYRFLAKEQAESNGSKPWSQVSEHLFITGNTYALVSRQGGAVLVVDPWGKLSADQIAKLRADRKLGPVEVVMFSHAHYDHYDGIYHLPDREKMEVWALDRVAVPIADPWLLRAPFLDARPVKIDRRPKEGESLTWREYRFRFHHLPGQSEFTMGVECVIDGKKCIFTADNWFHQDQFSGSGGWMGLNRSFPLPYAQSAQKVLDLAPDWVLAEHGGPFEFNAEDFRRRVTWGKAAAKAADALSPSGNHRQDWDPHLVRVEPVLFKARAGATVKGVLVVTNPLQRRRVLSVTLEGRGLTVDQRWQVEVGPGVAVRRDIAVRLGERLGAGRHILALRAEEAGQIEPGDAFLAVDVTP